MIHGAKIRCREPGEKVNTYENIVNTTYKKNDIVKVGITDIGNDGEGIGKIDGYTLFIKDAVIGDVVRAKIMKAKKNYAYAHLEEVIMPSVYRQEARCKIARQCGGCLLQSMTYEKQLEYKQNKVRNNIVRLGGFDGDYIDSIMQPIIGMEEPWRYRNKAQYPIGYDKRGRLVAGYYAGRTHDIIPVTDCLIGVRENKDILEMILSHMNKYNISAYDEKSGTGLVRHVLIRKGFMSGQIMVCIVINENVNGKCIKNGIESGMQADSKMEKIEAPSESAGSCLGKRSYIHGQKELLSELSEIQGMTSISVSINTEKTNVIMGSEIHTIWGFDTISDTLCGLKFNISPLSFYQVNPVQAERLYEQAIEYAGLTGRETVWDLYCGIGTITLSMAKRAGHVYGVEVIPDAIEDARQNALINGIDNADFYCGKAEEVLPKFYAQSCSSDELCSDNDVIAAGIDGASPKGTSPAANSEALHPDVIVVDPPRKGCDSACLEIMLKMSPQRIVYVSCDSATLARDLRILCDGGYELKKIRPCDMFSWSCHTEVVSLLQAGNRQDKIANISGDLNA